MSVGKIVAVGVNVRMPVLGRLNEAASKEEEVLEAV